MKTKSTILIGIAVIIIASFVKAGNPKSSSIDKIIKKEISYPEFAKKQRLEGVVLVNFSVNKDGSIKVNLTNESDTNLKDYVVSKLKLIKVKNPEENNTLSYDVKFEFKFEK